MTVKTENKDCVPEKLTLESVDKSLTKDALQYYTGFSFLTFTALFQFLFPKLKENPVKYTKACVETEQVPISNQLFLVLCRLRQDLSIKDLAFRFSIQTQTVCVIFESVIHYMYLRLKDIPLWSQRQSILESLPPSQPIMSILGFTELSTLPPSDDDFLQEICPDYKPKTALKGLVVVNPEGDVSFVSVLFSGGISENAICRNSGFLGVLYEQKLNGRLSQHDSILSTKGLKMKKDFSKIGLRLREPPSLSEVVSDDILILSLQTVDRRTKQIREFKLIGGGIPASLFNTINEVWFVCAVLTNFQTKPIPSSHSASSSS